MSVLLRGARAVRGSTEGEYHKRFVLRAEGPSLRSLDGYILRSKGGHMARTYVFPTSPPNLEPMRLAYIPTRKGTTNVLCGSCTGYKRHLHIHTNPVSPVAYQVILEPGIGQFREFEPHRVHTRIKLLGHSLVHKLICGERESV